MAMQDSYTLRRITDLARLVTKLIFGEDRMPAYVCENLSPVEGKEILTDKELSETEKRDALFRKVISLADAGDINEAENLLLTEADPEDDRDLELALTFYLHLNDMDTDFLDDHDYSREEILDGIKSLAEDRGVIGLEMF